MEPFLPPFCPARRCPFHWLEHGQDYSSYAPWGSYQTKAFGTVPRFICLECGKTFSTQTFSVAYYAKRVLASPTDTISNRISRAARQALAFESDLASSRHPAENLAADGFESFCRSQFFPNNITILVGSASQFVYAADHVTLRRKGRMTESQRTKREVLDKLFRPAPRGIRASFGRVAGESLRVLSDSRREALTLWTDEHKEYPRGIRDSACLGALVRQGRIEHRTISSRAARTQDNPPFPVNYLGRELRKDLHEHGRESVCFGRNVNRQMERLALYLWWHNYRKAHRARGELLSHAEAAGYDLGHMKERMGTIWKRRAWLSLTSLTEAMRDSWLRLRATPLLKMPDYL